MAYCSPKRFLGLMRFPASFNQSTAVIGHVGSIDQTVAGFDGKMLLSCDARHQCVHLWRVDLGRFQSTLTSNSGSYLADDIDRVRYVISYMMLKKGGHGSEAQCSVLAKSQVVEAMTALGCYLSNQHSQEILTELGWKSNASQTFLLDHSQIPDGTISLQEFMDLWLNHRPIKLDPDSDALLEAFRILGANSSGEISLDLLLTRLEQHGERLSNAEFQTCFQSIHPKSDLSSLPSTVTPAIFIEKFLNLDKNPSL